MSGYIKYWRSSFDSPLYYAEPFTKWQAWTDLLLLANYQDRVVYIRQQAVAVKRGQVLAGEQFLADRWKWSRGKVRRFLSYLESKTVQQIVQQKSNLITIISIVNYEYYQGDGTTNGTTDSTPDSTTDGQQIVQQTDTLKKVKNNKKGKEKKEVKNSTTTTTIFSDWEECTGRMITGWEGQQLSALSEDYPDDWISDAIKEAAANDRTKVNIRYITKILDRWQKEGKTVKGKEDEKFSLDKWVTVYCEKCNFPRSLTKGQVEHYVKNKIKLKCMKCRAERLFIEKKGKEIEG